MSLAAWAVVGAFLGALTGLVPGLHVNTLAALGLASFPAGGTALAVVLVAAGTVHTFVSILPATYLGAPGEDTALVSLPAHRLLMEGRARQVVRVSAVSSLAAVVAAVALVLPYKWLLLEPGRALAWLDHATPWIIAGVLVALVAQEAPRGAAAASWAALTLLASGTLGLAVLQLAPRGPLSAGASPLLPLLSGLFGAAGLLVALRACATVPPQQPPRAGRVAGVARGVTAAAWTAVLPGLTGAVATAMARVGSRRDTPLAAVATLSVVNTAHATLAIAVLWLTGRPRTGLAQAIDRLAAPQPWTLGAPPPLLAELLAVVLLAGCLGYAATLLLDAPLAAVVPRLPPRAPPAAGLLLLGALSWALTGWLGLAILAASAVLGLVPLAAGVRRVHLVGCLLVPILLRSWGVAVA